MNLILLFKDDFVEDSSLVRLTGRRLKHILEIHRAKIGDVLCVGLERGKIGSGKIVRLDENVIEMQVSLERCPPEKMDVDLILALPRPIVLKRILIAAASIGVKRIFLINTWRVEKSYWNSPVLNLSKIKEQLVLGVEQSKDTVLPEVSLHKLFKPFVKCELRNIIRNRSLFIAHPNASLKVAVSFPAPVAIAIGPEGGFIDRELDTFEELGFKPVSLGDRILRVETVVPFLLSKVI